MLKNYNFLINYFILTQEDDEDDYDDSDGAEAKSSSYLDGSSSPDARLVLFLTGLLMSKPVSSALDSLKSDHISSQEVANSLFLTWSVGLLSASAPWRMISAMTVSSILSLYPQSFSTIPSSLSILKKYYSRFFSTVSRRIWAERSAVPICSRYVQSFVDLSCSIRNASSFLEMKGNAVPTFAWFVDAATPISFQPPEWLSKNILDSSWERNEGWVNCDDGWGVWTGELEYHSVDWMTPSRSAVRSLTAGGDGPPMLREGCTVIRGLDWDQEGSGSDNGNEDGKDLYDKEKEKLNELKEEDEGTEEEPSPKKKVPSPKLPIGTVISIEPWKGIPGAARRVKWHLTNEEGVYRFGGDGGRYDIAHVDVNERSTRIKKRHPLPESLEQCSARYGFGVNRKFSIILRLQRSSKILEQGSHDKGIIKRVGILEMPDFGAGILVDCEIYEDGAIAITERRLLYGSKDSGWQPRFGQPSYVPGTTIILTGTASSDNLGDNSPHEMFLGSSSYTVQNLRNRANGDKVRVTSEMRLLRDKSLREFPNKSITDDGTSSSQLPPIQFDSEFHASSMNLSHDRRTLTCTASDGRCMAFGSVGFTKGIHYWEIKIEQADTGSVFIGVAEKPPVDTSPTSNIPDYKSRLNRWLGCGFVNFRATYSAGSERVYGAHCHAGDTIGVLLDCDAGRLSFFLDGVKYGEHIMNDLGCAYENISPFGCNADGCGSSGAGQGAPNGSSDRGHSRSGSRYPSNGTVQPKALWPVVGMRHLGDRVTFSSKWITSHSVDPSSILKNALAVDEIFSYYERMSKESDEVPKNNLPTSFVSEAYDEYKRWRTGRWQRFDTRGSGQNLSSPGLEIDVDTSPLACAMACASIGLKFVLLPGDRVRVKRSSGRLLELPEEAVILGAYQGRLWYQIYSQKSEGGSLSEGGGRAWFWDESEVVGDSLQIIGTSQAHGIELPLLDRFKCSAKGGLKIIYSEGAVVRLDLEIFEGSEAIGTIPQGTIIPCEDILERRMNSCGVVRFRVRLEEFGEGWISSRIRGDKEDAIIEHLSSTSEALKGDENEDNPSSPKECAIVWFDKYNEVSPDNLGEKDDIWSFADQDEFNLCLHQGIISELSTYESDSFLTSFVTAVSNLSSHGNGVEVSYDLISTILYTSIKSHDLLSNDDFNSDLKLVHKSDLNSSIASMFAQASTRFPSMKSLLARIAMLKAFNRRARYALPWLLSRPPQESSAVLGGLSGLGASIERCGKSQQDKLEQSVSERSNCLLLLFCLKRIITQSFDIISICCPLCLSGYALLQRVEGSEITVQFCLIV